MYSLYSPISPLSFFNHLSLAPHFYPISKIPSIRVLLPLLWRPICFAIVLKIVFNLEWLGRSLLFGSILVLLYKIFRSISIQFKSRSLVSEKVPNLEWFRKTPLRCRIALIYDKKIQNGCDCFLFSLSLQFSQLF